MEEKIKELEPWNILITKDCISKFLGLDTIFIKELIKQYIFSSRPFGPELLDDRLDKNEIYYSGLVFFYLIIIYIAHFKNWGKNINACIWYNKLYLLFDYYIDSKYISPEEKNILFVKLEKILHYDPHLSLKNIEISLLKDNNKIVDQLILTYMNIVREYPEIIPYIKKIFYIQKNALLSSDADIPLIEDFLMNIAHKKGEYTMMVIYSIIVTCEQEKIKSATCEIGNIIQLLDDMMDVKTDKKENIETIATFILNKDHVLDKLWIYTANKILGIDPFFTIYKSIFTSMLFYITKIHNKLFSISLPEYYHESFYKFHQDINTWIEIIIHSENTQKNE